MGSRLNASDISFSLGGIVSVETRSLPTLTHVLPPISTCRFAHLCRPLPRTPLSKPCKSPSPQLSRAESHNEPRLLLGSVVYFFLGAALAAEACCSFFRAALLAFACCCVLCF